MDEIGFYNNGVGCRAGMSDLAAVALAKEAGLPAERRTTRNRFIARAIHHERRAARRACTPHK